jgi:hypothetical protein
MQHPKPYLLFLGDSKSLAECKTATGLRDWCRSDVVGQFGINGCEVDLNVPTLTPAQAVAKGARSFVIGIAAVGGKIPEQWGPAMYMRASLDM